MAHCHIAEHMQSGMMFSFNVARTPEATRTPHGEAQLDPASDQRLDVVVVGGSQAGLAMAWRLQQGLNFVVLEAGPERSAVWRSRWDSLKFTPAQYDPPGGWRSRPPADTYPTKDPVADYLQAATAFQLPVRLNARVTSLVQTDGGFEVRTTAEVFQARQVVVAMSLQFVPTMAAKLDAAVTQVHSADYRNPKLQTARYWSSEGQLEFQIAEELAATPHRRPVDRHHLSDAAPAARRPGPVPGG